ncbi:Major facilitator superfamily domain-containing protein 1 [Ceratocystis lukuohia]|uniref:Lysosomal dipeptide transporter MFSD1 n=1 Tax=Ceratocystis lukuohia TaxID=2019550 RepID=A0ABR4M9N6_9PEZI
MNVTSCDTAIVQSESDHEKNSSSEKVIVGLDQITPSVSSRPASVMSDQVPWKMKISAIILITLVGFGSHWSSGLTSAMKKTLKKELKINNAQYSALEASDDFIKTALMLLTGIVTDRMGGARAMLWGNIAYTIGAVLVAAAAQVRSYKFMIAAYVIQSLGDTATQVAQFKVFSSWFPPSHGFASTLGLELGIGKIGAFVGKATANPIAKSTGDFAWVYWTAVFINIFTNIATSVFYWFSKWCEKRYTGIRDPATGEKLTEKNKNWELDKVVRLPWPFWSVILFSMFQTSTAIIFSQNSTELAQQRFKISEVTAGWYSSMSQYLGFFFVPIIGLFIDVYGQRLTIMFVCGLGMLLSMCMVAWGDTVSGTAASFGIYAVAVSFGPTAIIDGIRTSMWYQEVFGSGYAVKITVNNSMNILVRIITGVIQDHTPDDTYDRVVIAYVFLAAASVVVAIGLLVLGYATDTLGRLQWSRKKRLANGDLLLKLHESFESPANMRRNTLLSKNLLIGLGFMVLGSWAAYFWGVAVGKND